MSEKSERDCEQMFSIETCACVLNTQQINEWMEKEINNASCSQSKITFHKIDNRSYGLALATDVLDSVCVCDW